MASVCELMPSEAVTVALWLRGIAGAAVALKIAVVAPIGTVTDAGTVSKALLLSSVTLESPLGAVWVRVTVQVLTALCPRLVGLQAKVETSTDASRPTVAVCELVPRVAVTVALWLLAMEAAAVALKVAVVAPAATVTDTGMVSEALLLARVTLEPPVGAAAFKVAVQLAAALGAKLMGLHVRDEMEITIPAEDNVYDDDTLEPLLSQTVTVIGNEPADRAVPYISQAAASKMKPAGNAPVTEHQSGGVPPAVPIGA
jgi:hypothetical protein